MADSNGATLPPIKEKKKPRNDEDEDQGLREKFVPKNWKKRDLRKLAPQQKSRYLAYEEPPKDVAEAQTATNKRIREKRKEMLRMYMGPDDDEVTEKDKHEKLIGQLKAAEARNRIRIMRLRYEANRAQEMNHLISCQPNARKAVRLQALVPSKLEDRSQGDTIDKLARQRVEALLEDNRGLLTLRT